MGIVNSINSIVTFGLTKEEAINSLYGNLVAHSHEPIYTKKERNGETITIIGSTVELTAQFIIKELEM